MLSPILRLSYLLKSDITKSHDTFSLPAVVVVHFRGGVGGAFGFLLPQVSFRKDTEGGLLVTL